MFGINPVPLHTNKQHYNMKKSTIKAVIFTRVSSKQQDTQRQIEDLKPLVLADGYKDGEISTIQYKESATKNDISKRKSIAELQDLINNNNIECVYVTEISRLARRNDVLYEVLALLEKQNICLVVQHPMLIRTIENGKSNPIANVIISFMSYLAVSESEIKLERQKSGLRQKTEEGKICTSKVKFGYERTKENFAEINEQQARVVRDIFNMYLNGSTIGQIWQKYDRTCFFPTGKNKNPKQSGESRMIKILKDTTYIGHNPKFKYPRIVSDDLFQKVQDRLASRVMHKEVTKEVYFCKNLVHIQGRAMTPQLAKVAYTFDDRENGKRYSININVLDSLAKNNACEALATMNDNNIRQRRENASESLKKLKMKLSNIDSVIKEKEEEKNKLNDMYQRGRLTSIDYDFKYEKVEGEIAFVLKEKEEMQDTQLHLKQFLESSKDKFGGVSRYYSLLDVEDPVECQKFVREAIKDIQVTFVENNHYDIKFIYNDVTLNNDAHYIYKVRGWKINLYELSNNDTCLDDFTGCWENRIKRPNQR